MSPQNLIGNKRERKSISKSVCKTWFMIQVTRPGIHFEFCFEVTYREPIGLNEKKNFGSFTLTTRFIYG